MSSYEEAMVCITLPAAADHSSNQYKFMKIDSAGRAALAGEGDKPIGVLQDAPAAIDRPCRICVAGVSKVKMAASMTKGVEISCNSSGIATTVGSGDDWSMGFAIGAGGTNLLDAMLVLPTGRYVT